MDAEDEEIIRAILNGEKELFEILVSRYKNSVYSMIMRQVGKHEIAEDLTQESLIKAFTALRQFKQESKFSSWLIRIALNHTNSFLSSKQFRNSKNTIYSSEDAKSALSAGAEELKEQGETLKRFRDALLCLEAIYREVIVLCGIEERAYEEVSEILGVPIGTVRSRLNKARLLLKDNLGEDYLRSLRHVS